MRRTRARALLAVIALVVIAAAVVALLVTRSSPKGASAGGPGAGKKLPTTTATTLPPPPPAVQARALTWQLPVPINEASVLPGPGQDLVVMAGETAAGGSADGVFLLGTSGGALHQVADLQVGVHDAAAAVLGAKDFLFGGQAGTATAVVEAFASPQLTSPAHPTTGVGPASPPGGATTSTTVAHASTAGPLPQPRAGSGAVTIGATVYVVGGYDGASPDASVLSSTDGKTFQVLGTLPIPVQDAPIATTGGYIYVFGGSGANAAKPVNAVQRVDVATGQVEVIAHLPLALRGASAVVLNGDIYVAGGQAAAATAPATTTTKAPVAAGTVATTARPTKAGPTTPTSTKPSTTAPPIPLTGGTSAVIWSFDPDTNTFAVAGHLPKAVAYAGTAVMGATAWLVGGESAGAAVGSVEAFTPKAAVVSAPTTAGTSPSKGAKTTTTA